MPHKTMLTYDEAVILAAVVREPGLATKGISTRTGLPHRDVLRTAHTLSRMGLLERRREPDPEHGTLARRYWPHGETP